MIKIFDMDPIKCISVNNKTCRYKNGKIGNNPEYNDFKSLISISVEALRRNRRINIEPPYKLLYIYYGYKDDDNIEKPVRDALQESGIINNDKNIKYTTHIKIDRKRGQPEKLEIYLGHLKDFDKEIFNKGI